MYKFKFEKLIPMMEIIKDVSGNIKYNNSLNYLIKQLNNNFVNEKLYEEIEDYFKSTNSWKYNLLTTVFPIVGKGYGGVSQNEFSTKYLRDTYIAYISFVKSSDDGIYTVNQQAIEEIDMYQILNTIKIELGDDFKSGDGFKNVIIYFNMQSSLYSTFPFLNGTQKPNYFSRDDIHKLEPAIGFGKISSNGANTTFGKFADSIGFDFGKSFDENLPFIKGIIFDINGYIIMGKGGDVYNLLKLDPNNGSPAIFVGNQMDDDINYKRGQWIKIPFDIILTDESFLCGGGGGGGRGMEHGGLGGGGRPYGVDNATWYAAGIGRQGAIAGAKGGDGGDLGQNGKDGVYKVGFNQLVPSKGALGAKAIVYEKNEHSEFDITIHHHHTLNVDEVVTGGIEGDIKVVSYNPTTDIPI